MWQTRTKFEKKLLIILIGSTIILFVSILLYITIHLSVNKKTCDTLACLKAATQIVTYIDENVDPCDDFFKFACGSYLSSTNVAPLVILQKQLEEELDAITKQPLTENDHYLVKLHKGLINGCMNEDDTQVESLNIFKNMLDQLHGWPVVVGRNWKKELFDWKYVMYILRQRGFVYSMMLEIGVTVDPSTINKLIVRIDLPSTVLNDNYNKQIYINYMTEVVTILGADKQAAESEMQKVFEFIEQLKQIIYKSRFEVEQTDEIETVITTVDELQKQYHEWNWLHFINNIIFPAVTITSKDKVMCPTGESMKTLFDLIRKTPKRTLANYMFWKVFQSIQSFMPSQLGIVYKNYSYPTDRFQLCKDKINNLFFPKPPHILYIRKHLPTIKKDAIQKLLKIIKNEFKKLLGKTSWMDVSTKIKVLEKIDSLRDIIGATKNYFNDSIFEEYEFVTKETLQKESFLHMYLNRCKNQVDASYSQIHKSTGNNILGTVHNLLTKATALYIANYNTIVLPAGILQSIFYDQDRPMYLNFGALGSIIGHELTHGFCKSGSNFNKDGRIEKIWTEETVKDYEQKTKCIIKNANEFLLNNLTNQINGIETIEENIADYAGVKVAYYAYESWLKENGEESHLPSVRYTPRQLFWISAVTYHCYQLDERLTRIFLKRDKHALNVFRATEPLRNNVDFAKDFACPLKSRMNPAEKCQIF